MLKSLVHLMSTTPSRPLVTERVIRYFELARCLRVEGVNNSQLLTNNSLNYLLTSKEWIIGEGRVIGGHKVWYRWFLVTVGQEAEESLSANEFIRAPRLFACP